MNKSKLALMSSIAAIPAFVLLILLVVTVLNRFLELPTMLQGITVILLVASFAVAFLPVGILWFGPKAETKEEEPAAESEEEGGEAGETLDEATEEPEAEAADEFDEAETIPDDEFAEFDVEEDTFEEDDKKL